MVRQVTLIASILLLTVAYAPGGIALEIKEDFDKGFNDWEIYDEPGANAGPSNWQIAKAGGHDTAFTPKSNIYGGDAGTHEPSRGTWVIYKKEEWADAVFEVSMFMTDNDVPGVLFRYVDPDNFYVFDLMQQGRAIPPFKRLRKVVKGKYTELNIVHDGGYEQNIWYDARIEYKGSEIKIFWDNKQIFKVKDDEGALRKGKIALSSWGMTDIFFDDIKVSGSAAVEPGGKIAAVWGEMKRGF